MKPRLVHILHVGGFVTLCSKTADRVRWVKRDEAERADCPKCLRYLSQLPKDRA